MLTRAERTLWAMTVVTVALSSWAAISAVAVGVISLIWGPPWP